LRAFRIDRPVECSPNQGRRVCAPRPSSPVGASAGNTRQIRPLPNARLKQSPPPRPVPHHPGEDPAFVRLRPKGKGFWCRRPRPGRLPAVRRQRRRSPKAVGVVRHERRRNAFDRGERGDHAEGIAQRQSRPASSLRPLFPSRVGPEPVIARAPNASDAWPRPRTKLPPKAHPPGSPSRPRLNHAGPCEVVGMAGAFSVSASKEEKKKRKKKKRKERRK